jgi:hypothetical protein
MIARMFNAWHKHRDREELLYGVALRCAIIRRGDGSA